MLFPVEEERRQRPYRLVGWAQEKNEHGPSRDKTVSERGTDVIEQNPLGKALEEEIYEISTTMLRPPVIKKKRCDIAYHHHHGMFFWVKHPALQTHMYPVIGGG